MHGPGIKRVYVPLTLEHWLLLRGLAAQRHSSMAAEAGSIVRTELERQALLLKQRPNGDETALTAGVTPDAAESGGQRTDQR